MALNQLGLGLLFTAKDLATGVIRKVKDEMRGATGSFERFKDAADGSFKAFGAGAAVFGAGALGLVALGAATQTATEFGVQLGRLRTVIDEASFSTEDLKKTTMGLASSYGTDAIQQAAGLYETISAGITDADEATRLLEVANEFAIGGTTGLAGSVDVLTSAVNTYKDTGIDAAKASDMMFTAIAAGKTTAEELSHSLGEVAPTAHAAGVGFGELQSAIAALTLVGIKTPQAVTGLNAMLANLMKPSKDAADEAKRLGIEFNATALKTMGLKGVMDQLVGNTKITDDSFGKLFGSIDGIKAALALTANDGRAFADVLKQMENASGATKRAFEIMIETSDFQNKRFDALKKNALIFIGQGIEPLKVGVLQLVNGILDGFAKIPAPIRDFMVRLVAVASVVLSLVGAVIMAKAAFGILSIAMATLGTSIGGIFLTTVAPAVAILGAIALGIYAFRKAVDQNVGNIGSIFGATWSQIKVGFEALVQLFTQGGFSGAVRDEFMKSSNPAIQWAIEVYVWVGKVKNYLMGIKEGFDAALAGIAPTFQAFSAALDKLLSQFGLVSDGTIKNGKAFDAAGASGQAMGAKIATVVGILIDGVTWIMEAADSLINFGRGVADAIEYLGGFSTIIDVVKYALMAYTAYSIASAVPTLLTMGLRFGALAVAASGSAVAMASNLYTLIAINGLSIARWAATAAQGFGMLRAGAASAVTPMIAVAAAILAVMLAVDQLVKLWKELGDNGWGDMWKKFKNDIGYTTDAQYRAEMGMRETGELLGAEERTEFGPGTSQAIAKPLNTPPISNTDPGPLNSPGVAAVGEGMSIDPSATGAAIGASMPPQQTTIQNTTVVQVGEEQLLSVMETVSSNQAARNFTPAPVGS